MEIETTNKIIILVTGLMILTVLLHIAGRLEGYNEGYKQGQIDALTKNKVIYCLKTDTLNQSTWQLCEE